MLRALHEVAESGALQKEWQESHADREDTQNKKNNQREIFSEVGACSVYAAR
jgi:hypothetical protein